MQLLLSLLLSVALPRRSAIRQRQESSPSLRVVAESSTKVNLQVVEAESRASTNCDELIRYSIIQDTAGNWIRNTDKDTLETYLSTLIKDNVGKHGHSFFMDSIPWYLSDRNFKGLVKSWADFYQKRMKTKPKFGTVYVNCDAKLGLQTKTEPNTQALQEYCNAVLHFFRLGLQIACKGADCDEQKLYVLHGRHAALYEATYDKQALMQAVGRMERRPHQFGFNWKEAEGGLESLLADSNQMAGAMVYFAGGNVFDLMGLSASMNQGDPDEYFTDKVSKFTELFGNILQTWREQDLMLGGHSAGVMWQSPPDSLNFLYFSLSGDPNTGVPKYQKIEHEGNADILKCSPNTNTTHVETRLQADVGSYSCKDLEQLRVGGTLAAPACKAQRWLQCQQGEQLALVEAIGAEEYIRLKPSKDATLEAATGAAPARWSELFPESFGKLYSKTNDLIPWALRPHCCTGPNGQSPDEQQPKPKQRYDDNIGKVLSMYNSPIYKDTRHPIVFTTEGQAIILDVDAETVTLFDAHSTYGVNPLCGPFTDAPAEDDLEACCSLLDKSGEFRESWLGL